MKRNFIEINNHLVKEQCPGMNFISSVLERNLRISFQIGPQTNKYFVTFFQILSHSEFLISLLKPCLIFFTPFLKM